jgi:hypothetical protein
MTKAGVGDVLKGIENKNAYTQHFMPCIDEQN